MTACGASFCFGVRPSELYLDEIVDKADQAKPHGADHGDEQKVPAGVVLREGQRRDQGRQGEDHAAHGGDALLFLVGLRAEIVDRLPELHPPQPGDHHGAKDDGHDEGGDDGQDQPLHLLLSSQSATCRASL